MDMKKLFEIRNQFMYFEKEMIPIAVETMKQKIMFEVANSIEFDNEIKLKLHHKIIYLKNGQIVPEHIYIYELHRDNNDLLIEEHIIECEYTVKEAN